MAAALADLTEVVTHVAARLEAGPDGNVFAPASATDQNKYHPDEITGAAKLIDLEIRQSIVETVGHPDRGIYLTDSGDLGGGVNVVTLTQHAGSIGAVKIKRTTSGLYLPGILQRDVDSILKLIRNVDGIYGTIAENEGRYYVSEENEIYYVGAALQIKLAADIATGAALGAPAKYTAAIIRGTIAFLRKPNEIADSFFSDYEMAYQRDIVLIRAGAAALPPLEGYKRSGG